MKSIYFDIQSETKIEENAVFVSPKSLDIASIRRKFGLNQSELADLLGVPIHLLKVWEEGTVQPPRPVMLLLRIADRWPVAFIDSLLDYE